MYIYIIIGLLLFLFIGVIFWYAHRNSTTKKCPFCNKRYNINEENCPYCHQSTMYFYEKDKNINLNISEYETKQGDNFQSFTEEEPTETLVENGATKLIQSNQQTANSDKTKVLDDLAPTLAYIIVKKGERVGREYPLHLGMNTVGRSPQNEIQIEDAAISHSHAKIFWDKEREMFIINDLASTNGTFINDEEVVQKELKDKDIIKLGQTEFTFVQVS